MRTVKSQRRAAMYLAVLMTATIVAVIGISGLMATRVQMRSAETGGDVTKASLYSQSAVELGLLTLRNDQNWRTTYTHDEWTDAQSFGEGILSWKLVDEINGSLTADREAGIRLYGLGVNGNAVRMHTVMLDPVIHPNIVVNPGFETGLNGWLDLGLSALALNTSIEHSGDACLYVYNRLDNARVVYQEMEGLEQGQTYEISAWAQMRSFSETFLLVVYLYDDFGWNRFEAGTAMVNKDWTYISGTTTLSWTGTLDQAYLKFETAWSTQELFLDDVNMRKYVGGSDMFVLPGTWQRAIDATAVVSTGGGTVELKGGVSVDLPDAGSEAAAKALQLRGK